MGPLGVSHYWKIALFYGRELLRDNPTFLHPSIICDPISFILHTSLLEESSNPSIEPPGIIGFTDHMDVPGLDPMPGLPLIRKPCMYMTAILSDRSCLGPN
jgi:hypothetical protein